MRTRVELAQLHQRMKSTMIYVTRDQTEAMTLADRIVILNNCKIEQIGLPMEVYTRPASKFVADFVGSPAMNVLPVENSGENQIITLASGTEIKCATSMPRQTPSTWLGIWPENLNIVAAGGTISGTATVVEQLGERTLVYVRLQNGDTVIAQDSNLSTVTSDDQGLGRHHK